MRSVLPTRSAAVFPHTRTYSVLVLGDHIIALNFVLADMESASEVEDSGVMVNSMSKEDLYRYFVKMQRRSEKYKSKFMQVLQAYKEIDRERDKLRVTSCC